MINPNGELVRRRYMAANAPKGQIVKGSRHSRGYRVMGFENQTFFVHRVKFAVHYGWFPEFIDHINGIRDDNRLENLRASTAQLNQENRKLSKKNKSGYHGVYSCAGKWRAQLRIKYKRVNLGTFIRKSEAISAVKEFLKNKDF